MKRLILFVYQLIIGLSDAATGALLQIAPRFTLAVMGLHAPSDALVYLSFVGAFVFAVGLCCLYGAYLALRGSCVLQIKTVWMMTAILRSSVAIFILAQVLVGAIETGWITVAIFDGLCAALQCLGLRKGWLDHAV